MYKTGELVREEHHNELTKEELKVLKKISPVRIVIPMIIGLAVIGYLLWRQFDPEVFTSFSWTTHTTFWIGLAVLLFAIRHMAYSARLKFLSEGVFSWKKSIELIFIWEFSSAVSPTSLGGSVVAFFMLAQEKLSAARTATIVLYTVIIDTIFFILGMPLLYLIYGPQVIRPEAGTFLESGGWGMTVFILTIAMGLYGGFFYYGIFHNPFRLKQLLFWLTKWRWSARWRRAAVKLGDEIILSSRDMKGKSMAFHISMLFYTATAWSCRFLILNALIIAFIPVTSLSPWVQGLLYGRSEYMFMIMAFSPTPGSSGLAEIVFGGFLSDFVPENIAMVIAFVWRVITYYVYLIVGVLVIPNWIGHVINRRRLKRKALTSDQE